MSNIRIKKETKEPATRKLEAGFFMPCSALTPQEVLLNSASGFLFEVDNGQSFYRNREMG